MCSDVLPPKAGGRKVAYDMSTGSGPIRCCHASEEVSLKLSAFSDRLTAIGIRRSVLGRTTLNWVGIRTDICRHNLEEKTEQQLWRSSSLPKTGDCAPLLRWFCLNLCILQAIGQRILGAENFIFELLHANGSSIRSPPTRRFVT